MNYEKPTPTEEALECDVGFSNLGMPACFTRIDEDLQELFNKNYLSRALFVLVLDGGR